MSRKHTGIYYPRKILSPQERRLGVLVVKRITALRIERGYKDKAAFAYTAKIGRQQYGGYELGDKPTIRLLFKIVKTHNMKFSEFFGEGFEGY